MGCREGTGIRGIRGGVRGDGARGVHTLKLVTHTLSSLTFRTCTWLLSLHALLVLAPTSPTLCARLRLPSHLARPSLPHPVAHAFSECLPRFPIPSRRRFPFPPPSLFPPIASIDQTHRIASKDRRPHFSCQAPSQPPFPPSILLLLSLSRPSFLLPSIHFFLPVHSSVLPLRISPRFVLARPSLSPVSFHPSPHLSLPPIPNCPSIRFPLVHLSIFPTVLPFVSLLIPPSFLNNPSFRIPPGPSLPFPHILPSISPLVPLCLTPLYFPPFRALSLPPFPPCPSLHFSLPALPLHPDKKRMWAAAAAFREVVVRTPKTRTSLSDTRPLHATSRGTPHSGTTVDGARQQGRLQ
ncbi:unnamed protein product [Closterium sp. Naga37s-1]|nr:unnamed protein product [Closterium sp. Naga37s-1]